MLKSKISFEISSTGTDLHAEVFFNDVCFHQGNPTQDPITVGHEFADSDDGEHELRIEITGKQRHHTKIDEQGNIIADQVISIKNFTIDDIPLGYVFTEHAKYHHDFNGTKDPVVEQFFDQAGCNGKIIFRFTTPVYLWLLENM